MHICIIRGYVEAETPQKVFVHSLCFAVDAGPRRTSPKTLVCFVTGHLKLLFMKRVALVLT